MYAATSLNEDPLQEAGLNTLNKIIFVDSLSQDSLKPGNRPVLKIPV